MVLTGATGALGAHILDLLRSEDTVASIYCFVRAADQTAARERVCKALEQRRLVDLSPTKQNDKITVVSTRLGESKLDLSDTKYS